MLSTNVDEARQERVVILNLILLWILVFNRLLKEHVDCAVKKHRECVGHDGNTVVFREATKEVLDVLCHDESLVETSKSGAGLAFPALLPFLLSCCTALYLLASHSIRLKTP